MKLLEKVRWNYCMLRANINGWWGMNVLAGWFFVRLGWRIFRGELLWMDTHTTHANGGYKYRSITLSRRPVSANSEYDF